MPGRHLIRDEPEPMDTGTATGSDVPMEAASRNIGTQTASIGKTGHSETPIESPSYIYRNPFPKTVTCIMPYKFKPQTILATGAIGTQYGTDRFRLNSIYDVIANAKVYSADPVAAADAADGTLQFPAYRAYWMTFYRYWTVLKADYTIKCKVYSAAPTTAASEVYIYEHGQQYPPQTEGGTGGAPITYQYRRLHPNLKHHQLLEQFPSLAIHGYAHRDLGKNWEHIYSGQYRPGSVNHEVFEDELAQTWHKATEVPPTPEYCTIHTQISDYNTGGGDTITHNYEITIEYTVQLKDLKAEHEYIQAASAIPAIASYASQTL